MIRSSEVAPLRVAVSSLSTAPADIRHPLHVVRRKHATAETARNTVDLVGRMRQVFGEDNVSVSAHLGGNIDPKVFFGLLGGITISDMDVPDVVSRRKLVWNILTSPQKIKDHAGWFVSSVRSLRERDSVIKAYLETAAENSSVKVVRTDASLWVDKSRSKRKQGSQLERILSSYIEKNIGAKIALVIEPWVAEQTPDEFIAFVENKRRELAEKGIEVFMDIDMGNIGRFPYQKKYRGKPVENKDLPLPLLERVLNEKGDLVHTVTLNPYVPGQKLAHASLVDGSVDPAQTANIIGKSVARRRSNPRMLVETHPLDFTKLITDVFVRINDAYVEGANADAVLE